MHRSALVLISMLVLVTVGGCSKNERERRASTSSPPSSARTPAKANRLANQLPPVKFGDDQNPLGPEALGAISFYGAAADVAPTEAHKILASGMGDTCGAGCSCMTTYATSPPSLKAEALLACGLACDDDAAERFRASNAISGNWVQGGAAWRTLIDACGLEYYGLQPGQEWMFDDRFFVIQRYGQRWAQLNAQADKMMAAGGRAKVAWQAWKAEVADIKASFRFEIPAERAGLYRLPVIDGAGPTDYAEDRLVIVTADKLFVARPPAVEITRDGKLVAVDPDQSFPAMREVDPASLLARLNELAQPGLDPRPVLVLADAGLSARRVLDVAGRIGPQAVLAAAGHSSGLASAYHAPFKGVPATTPAAKVVVRIARDGFHISGTDDAPFVETDVAELANAATVFDGAERRPIQLEVDEATTYDELLRILLVLPATWIK